MMPPAICEVWILCFWWSSWTLADQYLIPFHPWSEIIVLSTCAVVWLVYYARGGLRVVEAKVEKELSNLTQTPSTKSYARQSDVV